jgi:hypothetical protein
LAAFACPETATGIGGQEAFTDAMGDGHQAPGIYPF